jgi:acyl carrier protein
MPTAGKPRKDISLMDTLKHELKQMIVTTLLLEEVSPEDIADEAPLFGQEGLGLDSVDALQLVVQIENDYGVIIENEEVGREVFASINHLADFIAAKRS